MHDLPTSASEAARLDRELSKFFDFTRVGGAEPESDFEERDQRDVDSYALYRYQPGYDEDLNALWANPAARIPVYDQLAHVRALPRPETTPDMQPLHANHPSALYGASTGQHLFEPAASTSTPTRDAPQNQGAQPPMAPQPAMLTATPAVQQLRQSPETVNGRPPRGANPGFYLAPQHGRPQQGLIWPSNIDIGLVEICTFCPNWFMLPETVARAIRNGWTREALGKAQLHALGALNFDAWQKAINRIQKHISAGCKMVDGIPTEEHHRHNSPDFRRRRYGPQDDLTASAWRFKAEYEPGVPVQTGHVPLSMIYREVVNWPVGNDRLLMTQCLEFANSNKHLRLDTSHWDWIIRSQGLTAPPAPVDVNRDVDALQRLNASVADPSL